MLFFRFNSNEKILILPPADTGSLGDDALCLAAFNQIDLNNKKRENTFFFFNEVAGWEKWASSNQLKNIKFLKFPDLRELFFFVYKLVSYSKVFCVGADVIDGKYGPDEQAFRIYFLRLCRLAGLEVRILGCSFNKNPSIECVEALKSLPLDVTICARDYLSQQRLETALGRPVRLVADQAFLVQPQVNQGSVRKPSVLLASGISAGWWSDGSPAWLHNLPDPLQLAGAAVVIALLIYPHFALRQLAAKTVIKGMRREALSQEIKDSRLGPRNRPNISPFFSTDSRD